MLEQVNSEEEDVFSNEEAKVSPFEEDLDQNYSH